MNLDFVFKAASKLWETMYHKNVQLIDDFGAVQKKVLRVKAWHVENFFKIIEKDLEQFLKYDKCCRIADNYLIAMVFVYFIRADFQVEEYTSLNFIAALYLALAMEEDDDELHKDLQVWLEVIDGTPEILEEARNNLFQRVGFRGSISRSCCESVMRKINPDHSVWERQRHVNHSGVLSDYRRRRTMCPRCV